MRAQLSFTGDSVSQEAFVAGYAEENVKDDVWLFGPYLGK